MTSNEETAVIQRTRLADVSDSLLGIANDAEAPAKFESELRTMARRIKDISREIGESYSVRKSRNGKEPAC